MLDKNGQLLYFRYSGVNFTVFNPSEVSETRSGKGDKGVSHEIKERL